MTFRPMKPETIARRAKERKAERLAALPGMIARRDAMADKATDPEEKAYWENCAYLLRQELEKPL